MLLGFGYTCSTMSRAPKSYRSTSGSAFRDFEVSRHMSAVELGVLFAVGGVAFSLGYATRSK